MTCSIVIRAYNEEKHIGRLLEGILRQTISDPEIIVVDSGSTDATLDIVASFPARVVEIAPEEFSFGRSLNRGIAATRFPFVVLASAHVYPEYDDWLERLLAPFADENVALTYGRQRGDARSKFAERQIFRQWFPEEPVASQEHPFCNNANAAIRRSLWETLPYDEELTGLEDIAWARRAMERGLRVAYVPAAAIVHVHEETPTRVFRRYQREAMALRRIDPDAHVGFRDFLRLYGTNVAHDLAVAWRERSVLRHAPGILGFRFLQFWGTYRGFKSRSPTSSVLRRRFYYPDPPARSGLDDRPDARRIDYSGPVEKLHRGR